MKIRSTALCGLFAALMTICAWIAVPALHISFTLQTFAVALTLCLLGGRRGTISIGVYLLLGSIGLPVFSNFQGGIGAFTRPGGGYIVGFLFFGLAYWLITVMGRNTPVSQVIGLISGLAVCYGIGTLWFQTIYLYNGSPLGLGDIIGYCVLPFILPDLAKLTLAFLLSGKLKRFVY